MQGKDDRAGAMQAGRIGNDRGTFLPLIGLIARNC